PGHVLSAIARRCFGAVHGIYASRRGRTGCGGWHLHAAGAVCDAHSAGEYCGCDADLAGAGPVRVGGEVCKPWSITAGGIVSMLLGAMFLVRSPLTPGGVSVGVALAVTIPFAFFAVFLMRLVLRSRRWKVSTGKEEL